MKEVTGAIICTSCDAVYNRLTLQEREVANCQRCGMELDRHPGRQHDRILPLTVASLIAFSIAHVFPIVEIELRGQRSQTTLLSAVIALASEGRGLVALLVLATTLLFPLFQMLTLLWLLVPLRRQQRAAGFAELMRAMQLLRPWGMIEIFLLGVLIALIKLSSMALVLPGPALWAFVALTVLLAMVTAFDPRSLWKMLEATNKTEQLESHDR
ncbi:MAG: paraquat-inducible protein A [Rhodoferax sp.]|jgi:paraquat-inducible protein A